ncbi:MAG: hypothetical protein WA159_20810 [Variovorax sp.]
MERERGLPQKLDDLGRPLIQPQPIEHLHSIEWEIRAFDRRFAGT